LALKLHLDNVDLLFVDAMFTGRYDVLLDLKFCKEAQPKMNYLSIPLVICSLFIITACAGSGAGDAARVKCPACGYQFDVEAS
jgi:hypothetical protein